MDPLLALAFAVLGAAAGALVAGKTLAYAHYRQAVKVATDRDARTLLNLFQALYSELSLVWLAYMELAGKFFEQADNSEDLSFPGFLAVSQGYLKVYDNSVQLLGALDPQSCTKIIEAYVNLKALFDEGSHFLRLLEQQREAHLKAQVNLYEARQLREEVEAYFNYLKKRQLQVKTLCQACLEMLKEFIALGRQTTVSLKM